MTALICLGALLVKHDSLAVAEPSPAGGWRAKCSTCDASWRLTPRQTQQLQLDERRLISDQAACSDGNASTESTVGESAGDAA